MASGLPIVATRHGGIPEVIADGENGLLCDERDAAGLALAVERLVGDAALWAHGADGGGDGARRTLRGNFGRFSGRTLLFAEELSFCQLGRLRPAGHAHEGERSEENAGEEEVARERIAEEDPRRREAREADGEGLDPAGRMGVGCVAEPGGGVSDRVKEE